MRSVTRVVVAVRGRCWGCGEGGVQGDGGGKVMGKRESERGGDGGEGMGVASDPLFAFVSKGVGGGKGVAVRVRVGVRLGAGG